MEITKISLLEKKSLSNDRIYFKVKIVWNKIEEIVELWGIEDNILVTKEYRPDIEKIIYVFNHNELWTAPKEVNKFFYPLRYFIKDEVNPDYDKAIRNWMITGNMNPNYIIKKIHIQYKAYLFYDPVDNVMLPLCQYDWLTDFVSEFDKIISQFGKKAATSTYALVARWSIVRNLHYLWFVKNYSKRYLLLEDAGIYPDQTFLIQSSLEFTCPTCHDAHSPAGLLKIPKPFYNLNKETLATELTGIFIIKISDPDSELMNYKMVNEIMSAFSTKECPVKISYNQYKKIACNPAFNKKSSDYIDYVNMIKHMGGDFVLPWEITSEDQINRLHFNTIQEYNLRKDQSSSEMKRKYLDLKKNFPKFEYSNTEFFIKYPEDLDDLDLEGSYLHHCVRSYKGRILDSSAIILFLRTIKDPDIPFVTMQIKRTSSGWDLVQAHGNCNCSISLIEGVYPFVKEWCEKNSITMEDIDRAL